MVAVCAGIFSITSCDAIHSIAKEHGIKIPDGSQPVLTDSPVTGGTPQEGSTFENDAGGWKIVGDAQGGYVEPTYMEDGGVVGGYIHAKDDVAGGVWYFSAPQEYLGNKSSYYGATLRYSTFQYFPGNPNQFQNKDIIFKSPNSLIYYEYEMEEYPKDTWTHYAIKIEANKGWKKENGNPASSYDIKNVLKNLTEFSIRGEYQSGDDEAGLDNVRID